MKNTLPLYLQPLMELPSTSSGFCVVCGRFSPIDRHHNPARSAGKMFDEKGKEIPKPTIELCGFGNNLYDADGRMYCHGAAHHKLLHFRNVGGERYYLRTKEPTKDTEALKLDGWKPTLPEF